MNRSCVACMLILALLTSGAAARAADPPALPDPTKALAEGLGGLLEKAGLPNPYAPLTEITHNRMYVPAWADLLLFDLKIERAAAAEPYDQLEIFMAPADGIPVFLEAIELEQTTDRFETWIVPLPQGLAGRAATLSFRLTGSQQSQLLLDDVLLAQEETVEPAGLIVGDSEALAAQPATSCGSGRSHDQFPERTGDPIPRLTWSAPAAGPDRRITIKVDGPITDFLEPTGTQDLRDQTFVLAAGSGTSCSFGARAMPLTRMLGGPDGYRELRRDRLYGSRVVVVESRLGPDGLPRNVASLYYPYRWVDVVDAGAAEAIASRAPGGGADTAVFLNTLADGLRTDPGEDCSEANPLADGSANFCRTRHVDVFLPVSFETAFEGENPSGEFRYGRSAGPVRYDDNGVERTAVTWEFDPTADATPGDFVEVGGELSFPVRRPDGTQLDLRIPHDVVTKRDRLHVTAEDQDVGTLQISGRATRPTTINLNPNGYSVPAPFGEGVGRAPGYVDALRQVILDLYEPEMQTNPRRVRWYFRNGFGDLEPEAFLELSPRFIQEFDGFMPWQRQGPPSGPDDILDPVRDAARKDFSEDQLRSLKERLQAEAREMMAEVQEDFAFLTQSGFTVFLFEAGQEGDVNVDWQTLLAGSDASIPGGSYQGSLQFTSIDYDNTVQDGGTEGYLERVLANQEIGRAARHWALARQLNPLVLAVVGVGVARNSTAASWSSAGSFAENISNTVSHEIAHSLGVPEAYLDRRPEGVFNFEPCDIMKAKDAKDRKVTFADLHHQLLRAAMGLADNEELAPDPMPPSPSGLQDELDLFQRNFGLQIQLEGIGGAMPILCPNQPAPPASGGSR